MIQSDLTNRWGKKEEAIYNLRNKMAALKRKIRSDLFSCDEKEQLTALVIRIMIITHERVGNEESATNGHFGVTQFKNKHVKIEGNTIQLNYIGKSGVKHEKSFSDEISSTILKQLKKRNNLFIFTTKEGFRIKPDRVNRYLSNYGVKSKDIRGYNANRMMVLELSKIGKISDAKLRPKIFNGLLRKVSEKIGHGASTLRTHYLLPEIEYSFYKGGLVKSVKID
jgi:DNA topoisomerase-1